MVSHVQTPAALRLLTAMRAEPGRAFTLQEIHALTCRPPPQEGLDTGKLHSLCAKHINRARHMAKSCGARITRHETIRHAYCLQPR